MPLCPFQSLTHYKGYARQFPAHAWVVATISLLLRLRTTTHGYRWSTWSNMNSHTSSSTYLSPTLSGRLSPLSRSTSSEARFIEFIRGTGSVPTAGLVVVWNSSLEGRCHPSSLHRYITISSALPRRIICLSEPTRLRFSLSFREMQKSQAKFTYIRINVSYGSLVDQYLFEWG